MSRARLHRSPELPVLIVHHPDGKQESHPVLGREVTIGRDRANRVCIRHHFVSKFHAKIIVRDRDYTLVDLDSANKTRVNGKLVTESPIAFGDELQFASIRCELLLPNGSQVVSRPHPDERVTENRAASDEPRATDVETADPPDPKTDKLPAVSEASSQSALPAASVDSIGSQVPAFVSIAGPLEAAEVRRDRIVFFATTLTVTVALIWAVRLLVS